MSSRMFACAPFNAEIAEDAEKEADCMHLGF